ncbi:MAG: ABC transporter ATP-binding protein [Candidatus Paceibacterota bacterium]|jgi:ATP-binding cassette subfamily B protein
MDKEKDYSNLHRGLVLKYYWQVIKNFKFAFFTAVLATIISAGLDIYIPLKFLKLWNVLSTNDFSLVAQARNIIIIILILGFVRWIIKRSSGFLNSYFQASVMAGLRKQAFSYMIGHSHSFFADNFGGSLTQKINKYAKAFQRLTDMLMDNGLPLIVRAIGTVVAIYTLVPKYAYILAIFCFVFLITALIYTRLKLKYDILAAESDTKTTGALADSIGNHSSVQLFAGHQHEIQKVGGVIDNQKRIMTKNWYLWDGLILIQSFYILIIEFIIFWIAIGDWGLGLIMLPTMVLIQGYLARLSENLWSFSGIVRIFFDGFADAQEMALVLDTPYSVDDDIRNEAKGIKGEIVFDNVTYIYENNNQKVFDNFSLKIKAGDKIAIVGSSGAGKSTFVRLLMRLFNLQEGKITIDGVDIASIPQKNLREQIGFVPQDPVLFHRTLMENIRYGKRDATDEEVIKAAGMAHCDEFIDNLPLGYNTYVGERGIKLSGGERQRVAIARAILKNAPILVLDEATSALDSESEMLIQDALHNLIEGKTVIVIAHRLSTIRGMNRIIVINEGKIIEDGTHNELVEIENGTYKKLWNIQAGGFEIK